MARYCIGDMHGRYDLFIQLIEKINFESDKDVLYVLGDVIDHAYGGIKILDYLMAHQNSCCLLLGNHEIYFLSMVDKYDVIMYNDHLKEVMKKVVEHYSKDLFGQIADIFYRKAFSKNPEDIYNSKAINKWLGSGNTGMRKRLFNTMLSLAESIHYDKKMYEQVREILLDLRGPFNTKMFVKELLELDSKHYEKIKRYLKSCNDRLDIAYAGKQICLVHDKYFINRDTPIRVQLVRAKTQGVTYVFGHDPVPKLHRKMKYHYINFDFSYRNVFSWRDVDDNEYYNIDTASNPIVALCLDDMSEYYVGSLSERVNAVSWAVPEKIVQPGFDGIYQLQWARFDNVVIKENAFIIFQKGCPAFLVGMPKEGTIFYTHFSWLDYHNHFAIESNRTGLSVYEIVELVKKDFEKQLNSEHGKEIEHILKHGYKEMKRF